MKRLTAVLTVAVALTAATASASWAAGITTGQLEAAGWLCFPTPGGPHCASPGALASDASIPVLVFDAWGADGNLLGTELLIRADLYAEQPCPRGELEFLPNAVTGLGNDYWVCHHFG